VASHKAFQRDDATVMVASLAFGMGIDKPNIRRIIHYVSDPHNNAMYIRLACSCCLCGEPHQHVC
jgi:superfamily II DNA helicase RecQ